ncbi:MAG TPA: DUF6538 domain-containing protein [Noviherbaspirillum sp.]|nr:DUF6538 domain-containing protein [Noviherbaspirillum sp.]
MCAKDEEALPKYLFRRDSRYYVRLVAPTAIHPFLSKKDREFRQFTGTGDLVRAKVIAAELIARKQREWLNLHEAMAPVTQAVAARVQLTDVLIQQIAGARLHSWIATDNRERLGEGGLDDAQLEEIEAFCKYSDGAMRSILAQGKASKDWPDVVEEVLDWCFTLGYEIDSSDAHFPLLVRAYAVAERKAQQFIAARNNGDDPKEEDVLPKSGARLSEMIAKYEAHKGESVAWKTVSKSTSVWKRLIAYKGDVFLDEVTSGDIYAFLEDRLKAKDGWSQEYCEGYARRALDEIFRLAKTQSLMHGNGPMERVTTLPKLSKVERERRKKPRFAYSDEQINTLLSSDWYNPTSQRFRGKMAEDMGARYFGPLIGLLHGVRVTESMQLLAGDVAPVDGVLCFRFRVDIPEDKEEQAQEETSKRSRNGVDRLPARSVKNSSVVRTIPVHPTLLSRGFAAYVTSRLREGQTAPLFPSAVPSEGGKSPKWGRAYEQAFLRYVRDTLEFGNGFGSHSFRHQFEDRIKDCQARNGVWPAGLGQLLSGRKLPRDADREIVRQEGSERTYGNGYKPSAMVPYLEQLDFKSIQFPAPFQDWVGSKA